jgi:hypothetical protein
MQTLLCRNKKKIRFGIIDEAKNDASGNKKNSLDTLLETLQRPRRRLTRDLVEKYVY